MCVVPLKCLLSAAFICSILTSVESNPRFRFPTERESRSAYDDSFTKRSLLHRELQSPIRHTNSYPSSSLPQNKNEIFEGRGLSFRSDNLLRLHEATYEQPDVQSSYFSPIQQNDFPPQKSSYLPPSIQPSSYSAPKFESIIHHTLPSRHPSYSNSFNQPKIAQKKKCGKGYVLKIDGNCVKPHVNRNIFLYQAPPVSRNVNPPPIIPDPEVDYNYVFIKAADSIGHPQPLVVPPAQQKTLVYVLNEEKEPRPQSVIEFDRQKSDPEVFYVNYREGENPTLPGGIDLQTALSQTASQPRLVDVRSRNNDDLKSSIISSEAKPVETIYSTPVEVYEIDKQKSTSRKLEVETTSETSDINKTTSELEPTLIVENIPVPSLYVTPS